MFRFCVISILTVVYAAAAQACNETALDKSRIVVAGGSITEIIYFLGEQRQLVGADTTSTYPEAAKDLPSVGYVRAMSAEGLLSLKPTLILGEDDMGPPAVLDQLRHQGVQSIQISEEHSAAGIISKVRCIAKVLGVPEKANTLIKGELQPLADELAQYASQVQTVRPLRAAVLLNIDQGSPMVAGGDTSGNGLLEMVGLENVFADVKKWKSVTRESMILANPDVVFISDRAVNRLGGLDELLQDPTLSLTNAARQNKVLALDGMAMLGFGPRTIRTALDLTRFLREPS
ncbi:MAG: ABC transporter substrate-binding protein [Pseudomonadota bacterium]